MRDASRESWPAPVLRRPAMMPEPESGRAVRLAAYAVALRGHGVAYFLERAREDAERRTLGALEFHASSLARVAAHERERLSTLAGRSAGVDHERIAP